MADVLLLGDVAPFIHKTVQCLAAAGHRSHVLTNRRSTSLRLSRHVSSVHYVPGPVLWGDRPGLVDIVDRASISCGADVVFPTGVPDTRSLLASPRPPRAAVIPLPSAEALEVCDDKGRFAEVLTAAGIAQPDDPCVMSAPEATDLERFGYPVMVKPPSGGGGVGVRRCDDAAALAEALTEAGTPLLVQEYIPGVDIDLSFLAYGGQGIVSTIQQRRSLSDREMVFVDHPEVAAIGVKLLDALSYDGLGHADLRIDERDGSVRVIEINPRVWGSVQYSMWMGINFPALAVAFAMGDIPEASASLPVGECTNQPITPWGIAAHLAGRHAPAHLPLASQRAWESMHGDPLPVVVQQLWRMAQSSIDRVRSLGPKR